MEAVAAGISLVGYVLVICQHWAGMALWVLANGAWLYLALAGGRRAQAVMWTAYLVGSLWGLWRWME